MYFAVTCARGLIYATRKRDYILVFTVVIKVMCFKRTSAAREKTRTHSGP